MKIAVEGCCHGELDAIYSEIANLEKTNNYEVDALMICGDFQAMRNDADLEVMACPPKYRALHDFHKYYTGEKVASVLTIVIGGNHEASNYLFELYHGGWLAPNIYFLGLAGCVQLNGLRIAGSSGIFKKHDFRLGHYEKPPYDHGTMRSIYHTREFCVRKLSLLSKPDIFLSHDWPNQIEQHGDTRGLVRRKPHFRDEVQRGELGSPPMMGLLRNLKPRWWFSAHMHVRFEATVRHEEVVDGAGGGEEMLQMKEVKVEEVQNPDEIRIDDLEVEVEGAQLAAAPVPENPDEIKIDDEEDDVIQPSPPPPAAAPTRNPDEIKIDDKDDELVQPPPQVASSNNPDEIKIDDFETEVIQPSPPPPKPRIIRSETRFLALDKCLPKRRFIEVIDIPTLAPTTIAKPTLSLDPEWLSITRALNPWFSRTRSQLPYPNEETARRMVAEAREWVREHIKTDEQGRIPLEEYQRFEKVAPGPGEDKEWKRGVQPRYYPNPQTEAICRLLEIENRVNP